MQTFLGLQRSIGTFTLCYFKRFLKNTIFAGWHIHLWQYSNKRYNNKSSIYFDFCRCTHTELILLSHLSFMSEHIKSLTALKIYCKGKFLPAIHTNKQKHMQERVILGRLCVSCQLCVCVFLSALHVSRRKEGLQCVGPMNQLLTAYQRMTQRKHRRKHQGKIRRLFGNTQISSFVIK